ncbi:MAG TPA: PQQ-binding-like beta-propeller repeat protein [Planctomycetia bacterium]|nr:PQQ-binding-like beta-propeller repeat protein [Planctomycetia bacterium]
MRLSFITPVFALFAAVASADDRWPQFRGPDAAGVSQRTDLPSSWSESENVRWKIPAPGLSWSSPIVWDGKVYLTAAVPDKPQEPPKPGLYFGGDRMSPRDATYVWEVLCIDLVTGKVDWRFKANQGKPKTPIHLKNTYASETPVTDGERIYAYFGAAGLYCVSASGSTVWQKDLGAYKTKMAWGTASSPILVGDRLIVQVDNEENSFIVAFDKRTGAELWRKERKEATSWSTPFVWKNDLRTEVVAVATKKVRSYDPASGDLLWELGPNSVIACPTPIATRDLLYVSTGYVMDPYQKPLYAIKPGGKGDISPEKDKTSGPFVAWSQRFGGAYMPSPVKVGDRLFVLYDLGMVACFDAATGKEIYGKQRLPGSGGFTASPWSYGGKVYCLSESGTTFVIDGGTAFKIEGKNRLDGMFCATPAIADGKLLIRSATHLYCIESK